MKKFITILMSIVILLSCFLCACASPSEQPNGEQDSAYSKYENADNQIVSGLAKGEINLVNHRGYNQIAPENTLSAFRMSKEKGFNTVECDVLFTKDNVAVLSHDLTIDRTCASGQTGNVSDFTYDELCDLDFSYDKEEYLGEKIPTLEQFLALCKELNLHAYLDIRAQVSIEQSKKIVEIVYQADMQGNVSYISASFVVLGAIKLKDSYARLAYVSSYVSQENIVKLLALKTANNEVFFSCNFDYMDAPSRYGTEKDLNTAITLCKQNSIPLEVWTVNSETNIVLLDSYISGVTTDFITYDDIYSYYDDIA